MWGAIGGSVSVGTASFTSNATTGILSKVGVQKGVDIASDTAVDIARDISSGNLTVASVATSLAINTITAGNSNGAVNKSQIKGGTNTVNPKDVNFMQSSIKNQTGEYTVLGNAEALKNGSLKASDLPEIRIWKDDSGKLWTLDHRRLASFRLAELESVPFKWASSDEVAGQMWKMTTTNGGTSIKLKLGNGMSQIIK